MNSSMNSREPRYKRFFISLDFPLKMYVMEALHRGECLVRWKLSSDLLPKDFEVVNCSYDMSYMGVVYILYHESWDIVPNGEIIPELDPNSHSSMNIEVFKVTDDTRIIPYAKEPVSNWRKLGSMI